MYDADNLISPNSWCMMKFCKSARGGEGGVRRPKCMRVWHVTSASEAIPIVRNSCISVEWRNIQMKLKARDL